MKRLFATLLSSDLKSPVYNFGILFFRIAVAAQLIIVHGLKKIGVGVAAPEAVPNPLGLPPALNDIIAIAANTYLPFLIVIGLCTRLAALPAVCVTLTGYFIVHANDPLAVSDVPYMYSVSLLLIIILGGGRYSLDQYISKKIK
ncbi:DoxX family protein [Flavobacterium album]|uniref:DoxX family protein n=1 Tax=Flavobacterium album TaxID=2175091 RepID=A0A2S1QZE9_9FLAO|nr:DoxX family protein [Flavobacterium album]AWH85679.1 DoxX family protein [Flavobacterium album]